MENLSYKNILVCRAMDGTNNQIDFAGLTFNNESLFIEYNFGARGSVENVIGEATLRIEGNYLLADLLVYAILVQRLFNGPGHLYDDVTWQVETLVPAISAMVTGRGRCTDVIFTDVISQCKVSSVSLGLNNADSTIKCLREQTKLIIQ